MVHNHGQLFFFRKEIIHFDTQTSSIAATIGCAESGVSPDESELISEQGDQLEIKRQNSYTFNPLIASSRCLADGNMADLFYRFIR